MARRFMFAVGLLLSLSHLPPMTAAGEAKVPVWIQSDKRKLADLSADLRTLDGQKFSLATSPGKILFVNYWATWCKPCKEELPAIAELYGKLHAQGLEVVAITSEKPEKVREFLKGKDLPFTFVVDSKDTIGQRYNLNVVPSTFVVDDSGRVALRYAGEFAWNAPGFVQELQGLFGHP